MYRTTIDFYNKLNQGEVPISYIVIETHMGYRAYAEKELTGVFAIAGYLADGTYDAGDDDLILADGGSADVIETSGRVKSFGSFDRNLQSLKSDILASYQNKTLQHMSVSLDNSDRYFGKLIASEPFIGRPLIYYLGFETLPHSEHLKIFSGLITEMNIMPTLTVEANEE